MQTKRKEKKESKKKRYFRCLVYCTCAFTLYDDVGIVAGAVGGVPCKPKISNCNMTVYKDSIMKKQGK